LLPLYCPPIFHFRCLYRRPVTACSRACLAMPCPAMSGLSVSRIVSSWLKLLQTFLFTHVSATKKHSVFRAPRHVLNPQVGLLHVLIIQNILGRSTDDDPSRLHHHGAMGEFQGKPHVLFYKEDRDVPFINGLQDAE
jgi:hypothetical protein